MADFQQNVNLTVIQLTVVNLNGGREYMLIVNDNIYMIKPNHRLVLVPLSSLFYILEHPSDESPSVGGGGLTPPTTT